MYETNEIPEWLGVNLDDAYDYIYIGCILCAVIFTWRLWLRITIKVNCWFCGYDNYVPRYSKYWWRCTICEQYNGFKKDGDYQKEVPGMHSESNTPPKFCATPGNKIKTTDILCTVCSLNQIRIVDSLKEFNPSDERYFDKELEQYKAELNLKWDLCVSCKTLVSNHLHEQDQHILHNNHNNNLAKKNEKGARRLNVKLDNPSICVLLLYKLLHLLSLLTVIWLWGQNNKAKTDFVLINACFIYTTGTFFTYLYTKTCDIVGSFITIIWLLVLLYGNFRTKDSRYLRKILFATLIIVETLYILNEILVLFTKLWRWVTYKHERKIKIGKIKDSPKGKAAISNPVVAENVNKPGTSKRLELNDEPKVVNNGSSVSIPRRPSTPDLLEGHLDAMFIQTREEANTKASPFKDKDINHVVAALKYTSNSRSQINHRVSGQVLRPATFSAQVNKPKYSGKLLRPAIFVSPSNNKNKNIFSTISNIKISEMEKKPFGYESISKKHNHIDASVDAHHHDDQTEKKKKDEVCQSDHNENHLCSWFTFIIIFFIFSIVCNAILAYKLALVG